ncbi:MAG: sigma-54-dependent transcriptional regulator [Vicinamibacterales bacterium]
MTEVQPTILVIDDEPGMLALIERFASNLRFNVVCHTGGKGALGLVSEVRPNLVLLDLRMPEIDGVAMLKAIREIDPLCAVVLMTAHADVDSAVEAVRMGALDYLTKPLDLERLRSILTTVQKSIERRETLLQIDADVARRFEFHGMIGRSAPMQELFDSIRRLAPHVRTVLITGETGTGKELVARALHKVGPRADKRFLTVNCSAVVETLFESELFGHQRGAFTGATDNKIGVFEHADGGTIFLDEVGELPLSLQPKLLRAVEYGEVQRVGSLQAKKVDARVIAATNRDLRAEVAGGRFRSDLFYRMSIMEIRLAPLRERREDISLLTAAFVRECAARLNREVTGVSTAAERVLQQAPWDGNVRELRNVIERACLLTDSRMLTEREIMAAMTVSQARDVPSNVVGDVPVMHGRHGNTDLLSTAQRQQIDRVLKRANGNKSEAARLLGISRRSLYRWLERLDLAEPQPEEADPRLPRV